MAKKKEEGKNLQELGYEEAYARLQRIVADMESEQITVDELKELIARIEAGREE